MANLSNVVEVSVRHFLLTGSFLHFVEESVEVELRTQVLEATETKRLSVTKQPDVIYYSILQQLFNFNRFASVKFYPHCHLQNRWHLQRSVGHESHHDIVVGVELTAVGVRKLDGFLFRQTIVIAVIRISKYAAASIESQSHDRYSSANR